MTPQIAVALSSVAGALLFLAAGYLVARARAGAPVAAGAAGGANADFGPAPDDGELISLRSQLDEARARESKLGEELRGWQQWRESKEAETTKNSQELEQQRAKITALSGERDVARQQCQALTEQLQDRAADDEKTQVGGVESTLAAVEQQLAQAKAAHDQVAGEKQAVAAQVLTLNSQVAKLQQEIASLRSQPAPAAPAVPAGPSPQEAQLKQQVEQLQTQLAEGKAREQDLSKSSADATTLKQQVEDQRSALAAQESKVAQISALEDERYKLKETLKEAEAEITRLKELEGIKDEHYDLSMKVEALSRKEAEAERLQEELIKLKEALEDSKKEAEELKSKTQALEGVEDERHDLKIKSEVMTTQLQELEQLRDEAIKLKGQVSELDAAQEQITKLQSELGQLRSQAVAQGPAPKPVITIKKEGFGNALQAILNRVAQMKTSRGAAIADEMGLVVAGIGEHQEALAASAAILADLGKRLEKMLPVGPSQLLVAVDANGLYVTAQPHELTSGRLTLTTLSTGPGPDRKSVEQLLKQAASTTS